MRKAASLAHRPFSPERPCARVLIVRLPCGKVFPTGPIYLASLIYRSGAGTELRLLDLASGDRATSAKARLFEEIASFRPELVAFSWRDIQVFSPQDSDQGFRDAFAFLHEPSPIRRAAASIRGLAELSAYRSMISGNLALVAQAARAFPELEIALGGPAIQIFGDRLEPRLPPRVRIFAESSLGPFFELLGLQLPPDPVEPGMDLARIERAFPQWPEYKHLTIGVQTKRGCPHDCLYCLYPRLEGRVPSRRRPESVVSEIEAYSRRWGARHFWFADAQLLSVPEDRPHLEEILGRIESLGLGLGWSGYMRVSEIDCRLASIIVRSGLEELEASIGSGSQRIVDALGLGFSLDDAMRGLECVAAAGYKGRILVNLSLNAPGETRESLAESLAIVDRIRSLFGSERVVPVVFFLAIQPGTGLERLALAEGRLRPGYDPLSIWPWRARRLIYNPGPLGAMIGRACAEAFRGGAEAFRGGAEAFRGDPESRERRSWGDRILAALGREL
jgi:hypothetical protein